MIIDESDWSGVSITVLIVEEGEEEEGGGNRTSKSEREEGRVVLATRRERGMIGSKGENNVSVCSLALDTRS